MPDSSIPIIFPLSSFPGASTQESAGRIVNAYSEPLDDPNAPSGPSTAVWRRSPGLTQHNSQATGQTGYRGGLVVGPQSYEVWNGNLSTVDVNGIYASVGAVTGTKKVSIARNQRVNPEIVIVDPDTGAFAVSHGDPASPGPPPTPAEPAAGLAPYTGFDASGNTGFLPQPNSVCFQDGYFFFGIANCQVFATTTNSLVMNPLTFITLESKADVVGQRVIAYSGLLIGFTSGGLEMWQDTAQPTPAFPYTRQAVLPYGLIQPAAIAGFETGFDNLIWVAQDYGVYQLPWGSYQPSKISPPDLDRFIENEIHRVPAGQTLLEAGCYEFAGKKFWHLTSNNATVTWEFNLSTQKWNERTSLSLAIGAQSRWRGSGGHPAFGKWLLGDSQSGNILFVDDTNYTENGAPQLVRIESGPVNGFPQQFRITRADFEFVTGVGGSVGNVTKSVLNVTASPNAPLIRMTLNNTARMLTGDQVNVTGVAGTGGVDTATNGTWTMTLVDGFNIDLQGSTFQGVYTGGGFVQDVTVPDNVINPTVAISVSKDGGTNWGNPLIRALGQQAKPSRVRLSVKAMGQSGPMGVRWRLDVSDAVYTALLKASMSSDPRIPRL